jgi:hypothetical protein
MREKVSRWRRMRRTALLSIVAAGLFAFGLFCVIQARYREV